MVLCLLEVITGPMFSGKSLELIRRLEIERFSGKKVNLFRPELGQYSPDKETIVDIILVETSISGVRKIRKRSENLDVIGIQRAHLFPKFLAEVCDDLANNGKHVIVSGLNLDFKGEPFETMIELIAKADKIHYLTSVCAVCGNEATRTQRLIDGLPASYNSPQIMIGERELYEPRCRKCHIVRKENLI
jgi:thymidine kinase